MNSKTLLIVGVIILLIGLFCMRKKERFENLSDSVMVFKLKKPNGRYLSVCYNCLGADKAYLCERGVGVNFMKIPNLLTTFYLGVEDPSGYLRYLSLDKNGLLCLSDKAQTVFDATFNHDHTISLYVVTDDPQVSGKYIQNCQWSFESSVNNLICVNKRSVCDENKYIVEMNNGIVYN